MSGLKGRVDELAAIMDEFGLEKAKWKTSDGTVELATQVERSGVGAIAVASAATDATPAPAPKAKARPSSPAAPSGIPVTSPMAGIYYSSSSPGAPAFAKEGDVVQAGQVVGLIEAMKVFNEITAPTSGTVTKVAVENAQLVQPGDPLIYIG